MQAKLLKFVVQGQTKYPKLYFWEAHLFFGIDCITSNGMPLAIWNQFDIFMFYKALRIEYTFKCYINGYLSELV